MSGLNPARLIGALIVTFFVSMAVGALIGRQVNGPRPVAAAPSPTAAEPAPGTPLPAIATPTPQPTTSPTTSPTPTPTTPPTPSPAPTPEPLDPPTVEEFVADLAAAVAAGDERYLFERLHPAVIERYGERRCRSYTNGIHHPLDWEILATSTAPWDYETDGLSTTIADATIVSVRQADADPPERDLHFATSDGSWRWFTDCGDPA